MKRAAIAIVLTLALLSAIGFVAVRSVFAQDAVRLALAAQIASAVGQPVTIDRIAASIFPRVTVKLGGVSIGQPARIRVEDLHLGTDLRALLSRQIVGATVDLEGAKIDLPLPRAGASTPAAGGGTPPVEIVSIDRIVLNDVEITSGGRTLRGDIVAVPRGAGVTIQSIQLAAEDTQFSASGELTNLAGPVGQLTIKADTLDFTRLMDFMTAFARSSGFTTASGPSQAAGAAADLALTLSADRATMAGIATEGLSGRARVTRQGVDFDAIEFGVFGGRYTGGLALTADARPRYRLRAQVSNIDVAALTAFAGRPGTISGRLSGKIELAGQGDDASGALRSTQGTARVDIRDGVVQKLGLVKTIVIATSMRADAQKLPADAPSDERFSSLSATLALANGAAHTSDLQFQSPDVDMRSAGSLRVDGSAIALKGDVRLSDTLSQQAGRDLFRYAQEGGRITLPVTIGGSAQAPTVYVDVASLAGRALRNRADEEIKKALGNLFRRK